MSGPGSSRPSSGSGRDSDSSSPEPSRNRPGHAQRQVRFSMYTASPPIMEDSQAEDMAETDYFNFKRQEASQNSSGMNSPSVRLTRPDNSEVPLLAQDSPVDTRPPASNELSPPVPVHRGIDLSNVMDVGLYTSGGLAPGATNMDEERHVGFDPSDQLKMRREILLRRLGEQRAALSAPSSAPGSVRSSADSSPKNPFLAGTFDEADIPLIELEKRLRTISRDQDGEQGDATKDEDFATEVAQELVRSHTQRLKHSKEDDRSSKERRQSVKDKADGSNSTKSNDKDAPRGFVVRNEILDRSNEEEPGGLAGARHEDYVEPPEHLKQGILGSLLKLYGESEAHKSSATLASSMGGSTYNSGPSTPTSDNTATPPRGGHDQHLGLPSSERPLLTHTSSSSSIPTTGQEKRQKWYKHKHTRSTPSLSNLVMNAAHLAAAPGVSTPGATSPPHHSSKHGGKGALRPKLPKRHSGNVLRKKRLEEQIRITVHIADVLQRQRFILRMCRALMLFGAPTHRLEEYMKMTSRVLEIDGQYLYIPGCMIAAFGDPSTHTSEMQLVRCVQGLNLSKLHEAHTIYKEVVHDIIGVEEASQRVDELLSSKNRYPKWMTIMFFGLAAAMVTPYAFGGWWVDLPIAFLVGCLVGSLQIIVMPKSDLYSNVFEVTSSIFVSFIGRAVGSIQTGGRHLFCFASIAQGALALILPGYIILTGSLELQSKNIVAGSVRMFYAIIYSMFLGFGITLGAAIYGWIDSNATSETVCTRSCNDWFRMIFVPAFSIFVALVNQASFRQLPVMVVISSAGYAVTYFVGKRVAGSAEFTSAIGAFVIGILGNMYSRVGHGLAFAAMLPAIFVQVPSGIASQGSLVAGIATADAIVSNGTRNETSSTTASATPSDDSSNIMSLGFTMIQVCIGITVGLFVATLVIYPFGKKRSGLFTF
uniref:ARAD1B20878p n=1 Tax=Blastobotrys adeninivorans TaxID=409370 RepID=A0A060T7N1_BLAAD